MWDRIPLDADEFIKALTDAIKAEHDKGGRSYEADLKKQAAEKKDVESVQAERAKQYVGAAQAEEDEPHRAEWISAIQDRFGTLLPMLKLRSRRSVMRSVLSSLTLNFLLTH